MISKRRLAIHLTIGVVLLALPAALMAACGSGGFDEGGPASPADVPELGAAQLGAGAGPTPIPVTPTPTPTPSPKHLTLYESPWEGTYTVGDRTKNIVIEFAKPELTGEGAARRREEGNIDVEGITMQLTFVRVDPETSDVSFRVYDVKTNFVGVLEGDKISGSVAEGDILAEAGTFEVFVR